MFFKIFHTFADGTDIGIWRPIRVILNNLGYNSTFLIF